MGAVIKNDQMDQAEKTMKHVAKIANNLSTGIPTDTDGLDQFVKIKPGDLQSAIKTNVDNISNCANEGYATCKKGIDACHLDDFKDKINVCANEAIARCKKGINQC